MSSNPRYCSVGSGEHVDKPYISGFLHITYMSQVFPTEGQCAVLGLKILKTDILEYVLFYISSVSS